MYVPLHEGAINGWSSIKGDSKPKVQMDIFKEDNNLKRLNLIIHGTEREYIPENTDQRAVASGGQLPPLRFEVGYPLKSAPRGLWPLDNRDLP